MTSSHAYYGVRSIEEGRGVGGYGDQLKVNGVVTADVNFAQRLAALLIIHRRCDREAITLFGDSLLEKCIGGKAGHGRTQPIQPFRLTLGSEQQNEYEKFDRWHQSR